MGIVDEDIARVREQTDIVRIISEHLQLRKVGQRWVGLCPFHNEKSPSFSVNQQLGFYHCFGCQQSGDAISFVREVEGLDFVGAMERLASKCGVTLRYTTEDEGKHRKQRRTLVNAIEHAVEFYHQRLLKAPDAGPARSYLRDRGITGDEVRAYKLGWAPDDWDLLAKHLQSQHRVKREILDQAGLAFVNKRNRLQDSFRARIQFPIYDANGDAVGFGGRKMPDGDGPKYKNSQESTVYAKSRLLYGLNWSKEDIVRNNEAIICEGYTDVMGFAQADMPRAVATCGTALTEDHVKILNRFAKRIVLAFDADAAGQAAAERFYAWEKDYEIDVRVAAMPDGIDPAELARTDPDALRASITEARPFLAFRVDRALNTGDLTTAEGRARAAEAATAMVAEHPNELVRDQYLMQIASRCNLDVARLRSMSQNVPKQPRPAPAPNPFHDEPPSDDDGPAPDPQIIDLRDTVEVQMLNLAVHAPHAVSDLVTADLFEDARHREIFSLLLEATTFQQAVNDAPEHIAPLLLRLAVEEPDEKEISTGDQLASRLMYEAGTREMRRLEAEVRSTGDVSIARPVAELHSVLVELRDGGWKLETARSLAELVNRSKAEA